MGIVAVEIVENGGIHGFARVLPADAVHGIHDDLIGDVFDRFPNPANATKIPNPMPVNTAFIIFR